MSDIFISYRRQDASGSAGRLADHLEKFFTEKAIFRDVAAIEDGEDFGDAINKQLKSCSVFLAVIGPRWLDAVDSKGQRRLDDPEDWVRREITAALQRNDIRVIPVLVDNAPLPGEQDLPNDLKPLLKRNARTITDAGWDDEIKRLARSISKVLGPPKPPVIVPETEAKIRMIQFWAIAGALGMMIGRILAQAMHNAAPGSWGWGWLVGFSISCGLAGYSTWDVLSRYAPNANRATSRDFIKDGVLSGAVLIAVSEILVRVIGRNIDPPFDWYLSLVIAGFIAGGWFGSTLRFNLRIAVLYSKQMTILWGMAWSLGTLLFALLGKMSEPFEEGLRGFPGALSWGIAGSVAFATMASIAFQKTLNVYNRSRNGLVQVDRR